MRTTTQLGRFLKKIWAGKVTAAQNIVFFLPAWGWFVLVVVTGLKSSPPQILFATFFAVFVLSAVPFLFRRVGLLRWWTFALLLPAAISVVALQLLKYAFSS